MQVENRFSAVTRLGNRTDRDLQEISAYKQKDKKETKPTDAEGMAWRGSRGAMSGTQAEEGNP